MVVYVLISGDKELGKYSSKNQAEKAKKNMLRYGNAIKITIEKREK